MNFLSSLALSRSPGLDELLIIGAVMASVKTLAVRMGLNWSRPSSAPTPSPAAGGVIIIVASCT